MLGFRAGHHINNNTNNHLNICIGSYSGPSSASGVNNRLYIDASGTVNDGLGENSLIYGNQSGTQGTGKQQYLRINGNLEIKKTTYDAITNPYQGTKPGQINLDGCLVFENSGASPERKIIVNNSGILHDVFTFTDRGKISKNIEFDKSQERSISMVSASSPFTAIETIKIHTSGYISEMKLGYIPMRGIGVGPTSTYNMLKWVGGSNTSGSIMWGSEGSGDGFNLSGGSSSSSDDTRNIHFGSATGGTNGNHFDSNTHRNIFIGHYIGHDMTGSTSGINADDNIIIGYKSFKHSGNTSNKNIGIGSLTLGGARTTLGSGGNSNISIGQQTIVSTYNWFFKCMYRNKCLENV